MITQHYCFVIDANINCGFNVFTNFAAMFATRFVEMKFTIGNTIPD